MSELPQAVPSDSYDDEIDLAELFRILWAGKWLVGAITFVTTAVAVIIAVMLPNIYRAEALLAPNDRDGTSGLSALAGQYGGLASLAGISLSSGSSDKTVIGLEILKSRKFISAFIERHDILVPLMAAKHWDEATGKLVIDTDKYSVSDEKWVMDSGSPSLQEAYNQFISILSIRQDTKTGLVTVAIEHRSPEIAKQWVDWLVDDLNATIMRHDVAEAEQAIEYLNTQIRNTSLADLQNVFFNLIEEQTKTVMLAKVTEEYMLKTLDPAVAPEKRSRPRRSLIVILAAFIGLTLGVAVLIISRTFQATEKN